MGTDGPSIDAVLLAGDGERERDGGREVKRNNKKR